MDNLKAYLPPLGLLLMSSRFIWDCVSCSVRASSRSISRAHTCRYPVSASWISIPIHLLGGMALLVGFKTRWAAALLALLCVGTAFGVHLAVGDQDNMIHF